jgi:MarR family 2-MHQ and catechol resistance regulon transcriptional repressor
MPNEVSINLSKIFDVIPSLSSKINKALAKHMFAENITLPQFISMEILYRNGSVSLKTIASEYMVTGANITCIIDNLEKEEMVQRTYSKEDRRVILAGLTKKGKEKIESILPEYEKILVTFFSGLSVEEQKALIKILNKLLGLT